jgi:hypothetical protein
MTWATKQVQVSHPSFLICQKIPWWVAGISCPGYASPAPSCASYTFTGTAAAAWRFENYNTLPTNNPTASSMTATLKLFWSSVPAAEQPILQEHFTRNRQITLFVRFGTSSPTENLSVTLVG